MTSAVVTSEAIAAESSVADYFSLLKPGVMALVVFSGFTGMVVAPGELHPLLQAVVLLCIALGSGAGGAINMWYDQDIDTIMTRTRKRPLPQGRIAPADALAFGIGLSMLSVGLMGLAVGWMSAGLLAFAIFFYVFIYTVWLKRSTPYNIVIGGAAGAFPPLIGWAAVSGDISLVSLSLFMIIFFWTPPHFWALALYRNQDYVKAGVPMLPVTAGATATKRQMLVYTLILLPISLIPVMIGFSHTLYAVAALLLGIRFILHAWQVNRIGSDVLSRRMFGFSIIYLFALFTAFAIDHALYEGDYFALL